MKIIKIGRSPINDVVVNDSLVSIAHCQIIQDDHGNFHLIDTNSTNGTYVNGVYKSNTEVILNKSDIIRVGNTTLPWQSYFSIEKANTRQPQQKRPGSFMAGAIISMIMSTLPYFIIAVILMKYNIFSFFWEHIFVMLCLCLPFSIISLIKASSVNKLCLAQDFTRARGAARSAKIWFWVSFGINIIIYIYCIAFYTELTSASYYSMMYY